MPKGVVAVIPAYEVSDHILGVVRKTLDFVDHVVVVDDACPQVSGELVLGEFSKNQRVTVLFHNENVGVGGALKTGYRWALENEFDVVVKIDGDDQMDPALVPQLVEPLLQNVADFSKGNRFESPRSVRTMPKLRLIGNGLLSLMNKVASGYWSINDPTNGFIAIRSDKLRALEFELLSDGYFFELDLLYRLSIVRGRVFELPMVATYKGEKSNLNIFRVSVTFPFMLFRNLSRRILYNYYIRDWSVGSIELPVGLGLLVWGVVFGLNSFSEAQMAGEGVSAGQAVATAISVILGFQLLLSFLSHDIQSEPRKAGAN